MAIAARTQIGPRRLRYAVYHTLVQGVKQTDVGKGSVRHFTDFEAFGLALAATLLEVGLKRQLVRQCLGVMCGWDVRHPVPTSDVPLYHAFTSRGAARLEVAEGRWLRLTLERLAPAKPIDTGWLPLEHGQLPSPLGEPAILLRVNLAPLRDALQGS